MVLILLVQAYAVSLELAERRWLLVTRKTWLTVVVGNSLVLVWLTVLLPWRVWLVVAGAFAAAGAPVVARSLAREVAREIRAERALRK